MAPVDPRDPDVLHLKLPNKIQFSTIGRVLDQLEPLMKSGPEAHQLKLLLDWTSVAFCSPTGITILAAALEHLWFQNKFTTGTISAPRNPLTLRYLHRMNFFRELQIDVEEDFARKDPVGFRPVTHVPNEQESPAVTRDLVAAVEERHQLDGVSAFALKACVNELLENVFYHAQSTVDALASVQAYKNKNRTELVIADTGRGIRAALAEIEEYRDQVPTDCAAIRLALERNVTTTGDPNRGIGLWLATELVRLNGGEMLILSNEGGLRIDRNGARDLEAHFWPGTLIAVEFRMDMPINARAVYDSGDFPDADSFDF